MTDPIDFQEEPDLPTTLSVGPQSVLKYVGEPFWIDLEQRTDSGELVNSWSLELRLRDENLGDELEARWRVVTASRPEPKFSCVRFPGGVVDPVRMFELKLTPFDITNRTCHRLQLIASRRLSFFESDDAENCDDLEADRFDDVDRDPAPVKAQWLIMEGRPEDFDGSTSDDLANLLRGCQLNDTFLTGGEEP